MKRTNDEFLDRLRELPSDPEDPMVLFGAQMVAIFDSWMAAILQSGRDLREAGYPWAAEALEARTPTCSFEGCSQGGPWESLTSAALGVATGTIWVCEWHRLGLRSYSRDYYRHKLGDRDREIERLEKQRDHLRGETERLTGLLKLKRTEAVYYAARVGDARYVKIGTTVDLHSRMKTLRRPGACATPDDADPGGWMAVIATEPPGDVGEWQRHQQFAHLRVKGEWFRVCDELLEHMATLDHQPELLADLRNGEVVDPLATFRQKNDTELLVELFAEGRAAVQEALG